jgi:large subunit ribosomal protein L10
MAETKTKHRETPIPETKIKRVKELADLIKNKKTVLIASIKNLPASQFQEIGKKLRGKAIIKVPKKSLFLRAIDSVKDGDLNKLKDYFKEDTAVLFSDLDGYELSAELLKSKSPAKAKPGQESPEDIEIQAGPTELVPGPAISELGAVGLQVQIEKGKITIREPKVIVKEGEKISQAVADVMSKLDIKPFAIGFVPLTSYDHDSKKVYVDIKIDSEEAVEDLKTSFGKSLAFAVEIGYANSDTISFLLGKAGMYEKALLTLLENKEPVKEEAPAEEKKEEKPAEKTEEKPQESEEKPKEDQTPETKSQDEEK